MPPDVSVVVAVRDDADGLGRLLASLRAQTLAASRFEVVVVANGCADGGASAGVAREHGVRLVEEPRGNRARARNLGVARATADHIAFTDADCTAAPDWLERLLGCAPVAPLVAGDVELTTGTPATAVERFELGWRFNQQAWVAEGWAATANLLIERRAFERIGGFDEAYRHIGEDADLCLRAGRAGLELGYCAGARIRHAAERRVAPMLRRAFWHGYSSAQVLDRTGIGHRAWRHPRPLLDAGAARRQFGQDPGGSAMLARAAYAMRVAGSLWEQARR